MFLQNQNIKKNYFQKQFIQTSFFLKIKNNNLSNTFIFNKILKKTIFCFLFFNLKIILKTSIINDKTSIYINNRMNHPQYSSLHQGL